MPLSGTHSQNHIMVDTKAESLNGLLHRITTETVFIYALNRCFSICLNNPSSESNSSTLNFADQGI